MCAALRDLAHDAIDADGDGYNRWVDRRTGEVVRDPPDPVPPGWLELYGWQIDAGEDVIDELLGLTLGAT
ncbi:MAG: hypothetical protein QM733_01535 [Ilumatobacteraceae bacterium]